MNKTKRGELRAKVEQQLEGYARIWRKVQLLGLYCIGLLLMQHLIRNSTINNPVFREFRSFGPTAYGWYVTDFWFYFLGFFVLLFFICAASLLIDFVKESFVQRELRRQTDLEMTRLQLALEEARNGRILPGEGEKVKRAMVLTDDGELIPEDEETGEQDAVRGQIQR